MALEPRGRDRDGRECVRKKEDDESVKSKSPSEPKLTKASKSI